MNSHRTENSGLAILVASTLALSCWSALAGAGEGAAGDAKGVAVAAVDAWRLPGVFGGGLKSNDVYTDGNLFLVAPIRSTLGEGGVLGGSVLFLEPYSSWGEQGEVATSLGLGFRHLFSSQGVSALTRPDGHQAGFFEEGVFAGINVFGDMLNTQYDRTFWQIGVGAEIGTRYLELRGNYYIPLTDRQLAEERREVETFTSNQTSQTLSPLNAPYATGHSIAQDALSVTRVTTTSTTIERLFRLYEDGMEGWDIEMAILLPWIDRYADVKVIGGYYSFDNQPFGPQSGGTGEIEGWKAGIEVRPVPAAVLSATWYEDEGLVGADWMVGLRMELPFEMGDLGDGKTFWGRIRDAFRPRRRHLAERLAEPVRRQNVAVKVAHEQERKERVVEVSKKTRVVSSGPRHIVLVDDVAFVNNGDAVGNGIGAGNAAGDGTAARPVDTIQAGAGIAQANSNGTGRVWNVYTQGTAAGYTGDVAATVGSVSFIGSGVPIAGIGGTSFGSGPAPALDGGFRASGIGFFGVNGYWIQGGLSGGDADGVRLLNVGRSMLLSNAIRDVGADGIDIRSNGNALSMVRMARNEIVNPGDRGVEIDARDGSNLGVAILGNRFEGGPDHAIDMTGQESAKLDVMSRGNTFASSGGSAFRVRALDGSAVSFSGFGERVNVTGEHGFSFDVRASATLGASVVNSAIEGASQDGISVEAIEGGTMALTVTGNRISNSGDDAIDLSTEGGANMTASVTQTTFDGAGGHYIETSSGGSSSLTLVAANNQFASAVSDAMNVSGSGGARMNVTVTGNVIRDQGGSAFGAALTNGAQLDLTFSNNIVIDPMRAGVELLGNEGAQIRATIASNRFSSTGIESIGAVTFDGARFTLALVGNSIVGASGRGISLTSATAGTIDAVIAGNALADSAVTGIGLSVGVGGTLNVMSFDGNSINGGSADAMWVAQTVGGTLSVTGTRNNQIGPHAPQQRVDFDGTPAVSFFVNGILITSPVPDVP